MERNQLKSACIFYGGIKSVATAAGVDDGNLSKWLRGGSTLSESKVGAILDVLGLPNRKVDTSRVHIWRLSRVIFLDLIPALRPYFPKGGQIARAPWAVRGVKTRLRYLAKNSPLVAVYAITDGHARAIMRLSPNLLLQPGNYEGFLEWRNGSEEKSILNITEIDERWISGVPTLGEFDAIWKGATVKLKDRDVMTAIREEGISLEEAIRRIRKQPETKDRKFR